jgi:hypothetical protein
MLRVMNRICYNMLENGFRSSKSKHNSNSIRIVLAKGILVDISQEQAIEGLQELIDEVESLKNSVARSEAHTKWLATTLYLVENVFGRTSRIYLSLASLPWQRMGNILIPWHIRETEEYDDYTNELHHKAYLEQLDTAKGLLEAAIEAIEHYGIEKVYEEKSTSEDVGKTITLIDLAQYKLRKIMRTIPRDEKEVQDKFEDVLTSMDFKYLRDQETIAYSSKSYKPDFTFPEIDTALEIKLCNRAGREKEIIAEINDDILAYKTKYPNIVFLVYDLGHIRDIDRFKADIESQDRVIVLVIKH